MRVGPIFAAALTVLVAGCGRQETAAPAAELAAAEPTTGPSAEDKQKLLASLSAPYNTADLTNGEAKFALCRSCHTIVPGGANMTGPNLHGVFGRKSASVESFSYSEALKALNIVWDGSHLDEWLAKPQTYLPGTKMTFAGLPDAKDRADVIAYLMVETGYKPK
jgi:cytochrome c